MTQSQPFAPAPASGPVPWLREFRVQALMLTNAEVGIGLASAEAGPTAAPTAMVLMASAAAIATSLRVKGDWDDMLKSPFPARGLPCGSMNMTNQGSCQWRRTAEICTLPDAVAHFPTQELAGFANPGPGTIAAGAALLPMMTDDGDWT